MEVPQPIIRRVRAMQKSIPPDHMSVSISPCRVYLRVSNGESAIWSAQDARPSCYSRRGHGRSRPGPRTIGDVDDAYAFEVRLD